MFKGLDEEAGSYEHVNKKIPFTYPRQDSADKINEIRKATYS